MQTETPLARKFTLFILLTLLAIALMGSIAGMYYLFFDIFVIDVFAPTMLIVAIILLPLFLLALGWVLKKDAPVSAKRDS
jgi:hypothetical protein